MIQELKTCKICGADIDNLRHFYRLHSLTLEEYCLKHFNRRDLLDGSAIPFKSPEQYFGVEFVNKNNLKKYLKQLPKSEAAEYCRNLLKKRKEEKNLVYTPLQIELVTLPCFPPVQYLSTIFDYYGFCEGLGLINKVKQIPADFGLSLTDPGDNYIIVDSRESTPLKFDLPIKVEKLNFGDYHFSGNPNLYFERKSLADFIGSVTQGLERLAKELERADKAGAYLVMIVENKLSDALAFNHLPWMKRVKTKATPEFIFHNLRELIQRFPRFQPLFVENRAQAVEYIMKGFLSGDTFANIDLQLAYQLEII